MMQIFKSRWTGDGLVLLAAVIWGVAFYFQKAAMTHIGPLLFLGLRALIATLVLAAFAAREPKGKSSVIPIALLGGTVFFIAAAIQQTGIVEATVTNTGFLTALYVVVTPLIVWAVQGKAPPSTIWAGAVLAFAGTWLLSGGSFSAFSRGDWLITLSSVFWSAFIVITGASGKHAAPMTYTCVQFAVVAVLGLGAAAMFEPISLPGDHGRHRSRWPMWACSPAPLSTPCWPLRFGECPPLAPPSCWQPRPSSRPLAGAVMLGERLALISWSGAALLLAAVLVVQLGKTRSAQAERPGRACSDGMRLR